MDETPDRIERQVDSAASAQRVWDPVSRPGWFVSDGEAVDHRITPDVVLPADQDLDESLLRSATHALPAPRSGARGTAVWDALRRDPAIPPLHVR
ncbi:hypothetical protein NI17_013420 [Thermobifida halotolerans]|uniref:Uncharacterized protein n=1 Tax=Thermobifida halotolerans TaxID=483545 RepID=A0A399G168_9ACTN|nr:hypothetical protein [Thermobifida halotolerans]UOE22234.1 hypothetical protein NI17_013420 [Thermobifida halotolerans]